MKTHYRVENKGKAEKGDGPELELATFLGTCFECGQEGHRAKDCPNKKGHNKWNGGHHDNNRGRGKFRGKCNNCGKVGHKAVDCWLLEKNKDKRPKGYSEKNLSSVKKYKDGKD